MNPAPAAGNEHILWDDRPANAWDLAYPVGNGRLGAMPFGEFPNEKILLNEETIWARSGPHVMPDDSFAHLEKMRELEAAGDYEATDRYFEKHLQDAIRPDSYQLAGWLNLEFFEVGAAVKTHRALDLKTGIAESFHRLADGSTIAQETFVSAVDDVIVIHLRADKPVSLRLSMAGAEVVDGDLVKTSIAPDDSATGFLCRARVKTAASLQAREHALEVRQFTAATIYLAIATNFNRENTATWLPEGWQRKAWQDLEALKGKPLTLVRVDAVTDHNGYFDRLEVDFGKTAEAILALPTRLRLERIKEGAHDDPDLIETYFQFGRYLLIASSRPGTLPANLQGIWNPHLSAPWGSDFHLNINIQMNYWLAETANLSALHEPFFDLLRSFQPTGREMAERLGMAGWCMGHATDVWGQARIMSVTAHWGGSFFGGQWMTTHLVDHYRFNRDARFLEANWDILTASTEFVASWLIPGPEEGTLMARPSCSPENSFTYTPANGELQKAALSAGNTFDQFMVLQVFSDYLEVAEVLGKADDPFVQQIKATLPKIYRPRIGEDGRLMEWRLPFGESEPGHRHISHVIGAFPGNQVNLDKDPPMRAAILKSIEERLRQGGAKTGWSRAWTIGMFARLSDPSRAYENLHAILALSTLDNLWDTHPPFQIDGNFGSSAAIVEMLLHSHNDEIKLLPALPVQWPEGCVRGLRARGDYTVDISWAAGEMTEAKVHAGKRCAESVRIAYQDQATILKLKPGEVAILTPRDFPSGT